MDLLPREKNVLSLVASPKEIRKPPIGEYEQKIMKLQRKCEFERQVSAEMAKRNELLRLSMSELKNDSRECVAALNRSMETLKESLESLQRKLTSSEDAQSPSEWLA